MAGNWKMFKTCGETRAFFARFRPLVANTTHCDIVICPPFTALTCAVDSASGSNIGIGAQNLDWQSQGAFTGEISGPMLVEVGCRYVIIGHSERRQYYGETDATVAKRARAALDVSLTPIVCVGELAGERESGATEMVLERQIRGGLGALTPQDFSRILIAYEPVWAIGTGKTATPEIAADAHRFIRQQAGELFGSESASALRILYGGSVKPDNITGLMAQPEIDGALVGGASLDPASFAAIVNF